MTRFIVRGCHERQAWIDEITDVVDAEVVYDTDRNAMHTFLAALERAGEDPCVHMEDDIELTDNFVEKTEKAIAERPNEVIQFFSMRKDDLTVGSRYDYGRTFSMNQCFYLPAGHSRLIAGYHSSWPRRYEHPTGYDLMMGDWLKGRREKYWIHVPSLVQHRRCTSLIDSRRSRARQSLTWRKADA